MPHSDIYCPPTPLPDDTPDTPAILDYAARAHAAADAYQRAMDERTDYRACIRLASSLARATQELTTAIADAVACGDNRLS